MRFYSLIANNNSILDNRVSLHMQQTQIKLQRERIDYLKSILDYNLNDIVLDKSTGSQEDKFIGEKAIQEYYK